MKQKKRNRIAFTTSDRVKKKLEEGEYKNSKAINYLILRGLKDEDYHERIMTIENDIHKIKTDQDITIQLLTELIEVLKE
jgi:hypothetical protein